MYPLWRGTLIGEKDLSIEGKKRQNQKTQVDFGSNWINPFLLHQFFGMGHEMPGKITWHWTWKVKGANWSPVPQPPLLPSLAGKLLLVITEKDIRSTSVKIDESPTFLQCCLYVICHEMSSNMKEGENWRRNMQETLSPCTLPSPPKILGRRVTVSDHHS